LGTDDAAGERLASETDHPSPLAQRSVCRHTPEVGAVCGKAAGTALCGGRSVMSVPTASCGLCCGALGPLMAPKRPQACPPEGPLTEGLRTTYSRVDFFSP
jgi:hypothetical protein